MQHPTSFTQLDYMYCFREGYPTFQSWQMIWLIFSVFFCRTVHIYCICYEWHLFILNVLWQVVVICFFQKILNCPNISHVVRWQKWHVTCRNLTRGTFSDLAQPVVTMRNGLVKQNQEATGCICVCNTYVCVYVCVYVWLCVCAWYRSTFCIMPCQSSHSSAAVLHSMTTLTASSWSRELSTRSFLHWSL